MKILLVLLIALMGLIAMACSAGDSDVEGDGGSSGTANSTAGSSTSTESGSAGASSGTSSGEAQGASGETSAGSSPTCLAVATMIYQGSSSFDAARQDVEDGSESAAESDLRQAAHDWVESYDSLLAGADGSVMDGPVKSIVDVCVQLYPDDIFEPSTVPALPEAISGDVGGEACFLLGGAEGTDEYTADFMERMEGAIQALEGGSLNVAETEILNIAQKVWAAKDKVYSGEMLIPFELIRTLYDACRENFRTEFREGSEASR